MAVAVISYSPLSLSRLLGEDVLPVSGVSSSHSLPLAHVFSVLLLIPLTAQPLQSQGRKITEYIHSNELLVYYASIAIASACNSIYNCYIEIYAYNHTHSDTFYSSYIVVEI